MIRIDDKKITVGMEHSLPSISRRASTLAINSSPQGMMGYDPAIASVSLEGIFDSLAKLFKKDTPVSDFIPSRTNYTKDILVKVQNKGFDAFMDLPIQVQEGMSKSLAEWITVLSESYREIINIDDHLNKLISIMKDNIENPGNMRSLSNYGITKLDEVDKLERKFHSLFKGHKNKTAFGDIVSDEKEMDDVVSQYTSLIETRVKINTNSIKQKIDEISKLGTEFINKHANEITSNRRLVQDLANHIRTIANYITYLSLVDYSFKVLEKSLNEFSRKY